MDMTNVLRSAGGENSENYACSRGIFSKNDAETLKLCG
jgi:hypothetical protein